MNIEKALQKMVVDCENACKSCKKNKQVVDALKEIIKNCVANIEAIERKADVNLQILKMAKNEPENLINHFISLDREKIV